MDPIISSPPHKKSRPEIYEEIARENKGIITLPMVLTFYKKDSIDRPLWHDFVHTLSNDPGTYQCIFDGTNTYQDFGKDEKEAQTQERDAQREHLYLLKSELKREHNSHASTPEIFMLRSFFDYDNPPTRSDVEKIVQEAQDWLVEHTNTVFYAVTNILGNICRWLPVNRGTSFSSEFTRFNSDPWRCRKFLNQAIVSIDQPIPYIEHIPGE